MRPYEVQLDGVRAWPPDDGRPPCDHPHARARAAAHGSSSARAASAIRSARRTRSRRPSTSSASASTRSGRSRGGCRRAARSGPTACSCWATRSTRTRRRRETREFIRARRDTSEPPGEQVADFEEYARLYREAWSDPDIRWLLATVPSTMIFDDHDVHDDWNSSEAWVRDIRAAAVVGGAHHRRVHGVLDLPAHRQPGAAGAGRGALLAEVSRSRGRRPPPARVRARDRPRVGVEPLRLPPRLRPLAPVVIDSRAARVLADGQRDMVDAEEWQWIAEHARGAFDHLIIASTLPVFMTPGRRRHRGLERGDLLGRLGTPGGARRREAPARARSRALAGVPALVPDDDRAAARARRGAGRPGHDLVHRRRRPYGLRRGGRRSASGRRAGSSRSSARRSATRSQPRERRVVKRA